jgi:hypothetical protein
MVDPAFVEIESRLNRLDTDTSVYSLIELLTSVSQSTVPEFIAKALVTAAKLAGPSKSLPLLKFAHLYGKKDSKFLNAVRNKLPVIAVYCFQVAVDRETLKLYLGSWLTNPTWRVHGEECLGAIAIFEHKASLEAVCVSLDRSDVTRALGDPKAEHSKLIVDLEGRLACAIEALNVIESIR